MRHRHIKEDSVHDYLSARKAIRATAISCDLRRKLQRSSAGRARRQGALTPVPEALHGLYAFAETDVGVRR